MIGCCNNQSRASSTQWPAPPARGMRIVSTQGTIEVGLCESSHYPYLIGRQAGCCGVKSCPFVRVSVSFSKFHEPDTHDCCGHPCEAPCSKLVRHVRFPRDMLVTFSPRKLLPWNLSLLKSTNLPHNGFSRFQIGLSSTLLSMLCF